MVRLLRYCVLGFLLLCAGCGSVGIIDPTATPPPLQVEAEMVRDLDLLVSVKNNTAQPLDLGGWLVRVAPISNPTLVKAVTAPASFAIPPGQVGRIHTAGGTSAGSALFLDVHSTVPLEAWSGGILIDMQDPKTGQTITRYVYTYVLKEPTN